MKTNTRQTVEIDITLTEAEAKYLKGLLQNYPGDLDDEDQYDQVMRGNLFNALKDALKQ